eukprot:8096-Heterococcus_DN1.PRE.2
MPPRRKPSTPEASRSSSAGSSSSKKRRIVDYFAKQASSNTGAASPSKTAPPSWGKQVDPVQQRRWQLVSSANPPVAWAIRSYRMSYVPVFQAHSAVPSTLSALSLLAFMIPELDDRQPGT